MNKGRSTKEKIISNVYSVVLIISALYIAIDIALYSNSAVAMLFLVAAIWLYSKNTDIKNKNDSDERFNEKMCLFYAHKFTKYKGDCILNAELVDINTVKINLDSDMTKGIDIIEINVRDFNKLKDTYDYANLDDYIKQYTNNHINVGLPQSANKLSLEISVGNYLNKLP